MFRKLMTLALAALALAMFVPTTQAATTFNLAAATAGHDVYYQVWSPTGTDLGIWLHHLDVAKMDLATGVFSGTGYFKANGDYTWAVVTGKVVDAAMTLKTEYTGLSSGYTCDHTGTVASNTSFKGDCKDSISQTCKYWTLDQQKPTDGDNDGVPDNKDQCLSTPAGDKVNKDGCSMIQLCPCAYWSNHGEYVSCVAKAKKIFVDAGILTNKEAGEIQSAAGQSDCGKKK
jgi:hypothetical protein